MTLPFLTFGPKSHRSKKSKVLIAITLLTKTVDIFFLFHCIFLNILRAVVKKRMNFIVYDDANYNLFVNMTSTTQIEQNLPSMRTDGVKGMLSNPHISDDDKFNIYRKIFAADSNSTIDTHSTVILYEYMSTLTEDKIDLIATWSTIHDYQFFRHLPSLQLIEKYFIANDSNQSNKLHGVTNNALIDRNDRRGFLLQQIRVMQSKLKEDDQETQSTEPVSTDIHSEL
jgi:hypothetical protein